MKLTTSSPIFSLLLIPTLVVWPLSAQSPLVAATPAAGDSAIAQTPTNTVPADLRLHVLPSAETAAKANSVFEQGLTVALTNASGAAVADAAIALRLPDSGPTGAFADGSHAAVAYTDTAGQAHFAAARWNQVPGALTMRVTATKGTSHAALLLNETLTSNTATVIQVPSTSAQTTSAPPVAPLIQQPGQPAIAQPASKAAANPILTPTATSSTVPPPVPVVSVTGASPNSSQHSSKTKWIILAAVVAAAAGAGVAVAGKGKSSAPAAATNSLSVGAPSVSVGAP